MSKYFWEIGVLLIIVVTDYISLAVSLSNTITTAFLLGDDPVRHILFLFNVFFAIIFFVLKLMGLCESNASIEKIICNLNDTSFFKFPNL